jgi:sugar/nucleoside kinase (ribokinase family)
MAHVSSVLSIGEFLIDLIASGDATSLLDADTLSVRPGGAPANVAVALARQGVPAALCSVVGRDPFGERLIRVLDRNGVDRSRVRQDPRVDTTLAFAWKDARGDGHFRLLRQADVLLDVDDISAAGTPHVSAIVVGSVSLSQQPARTAVEKAVEIAVDAGVPVCFDVNMRPTVWPSREASRAACEPILVASTLLKLSLDDARYLLDIDEGAGAREVVGALTLYGNDVIVLTDGDRGAWFSNWLGTHHSAPEHVPAFDIEAVEPTGAGDAFMASVIARLLANDWDEITASDVRYASAAGALTTTRPGAIDSLPTSSEIDAFLVAHPG